MHSVQARPFRLLGDSAVRAVRDALVQALSGWAADWGVASAHVDVSVQRAWDSGPARKLAWNQSAQASGRRLWLAVGADFSIGLQQAMFPSDAAYVPAIGASPSLAPAAAEKAQEALLDALVCAVLLSQQSAPRDGAAVPFGHWERGSGAVVAQLAIGRRHCHLLLDGPAVQALLAPAAPLPALPAVDVTAGVSGVPVSLRLEAGTARVGLGALLSLAPGDVIRLDRQADAPLALHAMSGHRLFDAYLGRSGDGIAVELVHSSNPVGEVS
jgi:hypothetical protein